MASLAQYVADTLADQGVRRIFGIPGGGSSLDLIDAANRAGIDFVLTRTETAAALMAAVTGEMTGRPGVALTGIGPGAASAVNGIAYAYLERAPVILFTDGPAASLHQSFDQNALFRPVTKIQGRLQRNTAIEAFSDFLAPALTPPWGPVQIELTAADAAAALGTPRAIFQPLPVARDLTALSKARALLGDSRRPVLIAGLEARHGAAPAGLRTMLDALACPVLLTYKAKGVLPSSDPYAVGLFTGGTAEADILRRADLIVLYGFDPIEMIPAPWRGDAPVLDLRTVPGADLPIRPAASLFGPLDELPARLSDSGVSPAWSRDEIAALRDGLRSRSALAGSGHTAQSVTEALRAVAPPSTRLTVDAGAHMFSVMTTWDAVEPFGVLKSNGLSTMGFALPAAIASALEEPDRPVVAVIGDGGLAMCLGELATAIERKCRLVVIVLNDAALSLIDIKQAAQQRPRSGVSTARADFAAVARAFGWETWSIGQGDSLNPVLQKAFSAEAPVLLDIAIDPSGYGDQLAALRG